MHDVRTSLNSVNENLVPYGKKLPPSLHSVKNYLLKPVARLDLGSKPSCTVNPLAPAGQQVSLSWKKCEVPYSQQFCAGGVTSGKLLRCGLAWKHVTYYDEQMRPLSFPSGYTLKRSTSEKDENAAYYAAYQVEEFLEKHPELLSGVSENTSAPAASDPLQVERERDTARRKRRQKDRCKDLVNKNYLNYMFTFTFALEENINVHGLRFILPAAKQRDRAAVETVWNTQLTMIRREMSARGKDFKFVKVLERHDGEDTDARKRGCYHIHLATDRDFEKDFLQELWGYGIVSVDNFNRKKTTVKGNTVNVERDGCVISPGDYMAKYIDKDFEECDALGHRAYSPSQNLVKPIPDKDTDTRKAYLAQPSTGFSEFDKVHIEEVEPGLFAKINALVDIESVKVFDKTFAVEFQRVSPDTGETEPVKMFVRYELYNFRLLMNNARRLWENLRAKEVMSYERRVNHQLCREDEKPALFL